MNISNNTFTNLRTKYTSVTDEGKQGEEASGVKEENPPLNWRWMLLSRIAGGLMVYVEKLGKGEKLKRAVSSAFIMKAG